MSSKYTHLRTLWILCLWACCCTTRAQTTGIGVTLIDYNLDTLHQVDLGYTITFNAQVTNFSADSFSGTLNFGLHDSFHVFTSSSIFDKPPYSGDNIVLAGHETVPAIFSVNVSPQYFTPGPDVVVVWPICTAPHSDSIVFHMIVLDPSAIADAGTNTFTYAITQGKILFRSTQQDFGFEQVRIYDMLGRQVSSADGNNIAQISIANLSKGVYICQVLTATNQRITFKFFNQ